MQRWIELPYAYQTVGSAMVVRSHAYAKEGGMSIKQAGEDFYFMHKYSKNLTLGEINETIVAPSGRSSDRVPFGTGKAVSDILSKTHNQYCTYHPQGFVVLKEWLADINDLLVANKNNYNKIPQPENAVLSGYLDTLKYREIIRKDILTTSAGWSRIKKFYQWFDAFRLMKFLHYFRDKEAADKSLLLACQEYSKLMNEEPLIDEWSYLIAFREKDINANYNDQWRAGFISKLSNISAS